MVPQKVICWPFSKAAAWRLPGSVEMMVMLRLVMSPYLGLVKPILAEGIAEVVSQVGVVVVTGISLLDQVSKGMYGVPVGRLIRPYIQYSYVVLGEAVVSTKLLESALKSPVIKL